MHANIWVTSTYAPVSLGTSRCTAGLTLISQTRHIAADTAHQLTNLGTSTPSRTPDAVPSGCVTTERAAPSVGTPTRPPPLHMATQSVRVPPLGRRAASPRNRSPFAHPYRLPPWVGIPNLEPAPRHRPPASPPPGHGVNMTGTKPCLPERRRFRQPAPVRGETHSPGRRIPTLRPSPGRGQGVFTKRGCFAK